MPSTPCANAFFDPSYSEKARNKYFKEENASPKEFWKNGQISKTKVSKESVR